MQIVLIRHGQTPGNALRRYIGRTDEPLSAEGVRALEAFGTLPDVRHVFVTPLCRTQQTARILLPCAEQTVLPALREMDFGDFENRSADDMTDSAVYRAWVEGGCLGRCPNGESTPEFSARVCEGFQNALRTLPEDTGRAFFVVHGGVIMSIISRFARPETAYFDAWVQNGCGYVCTLGEADGEMILPDARRISCAAEVTA